MHTGLFHGNLCGQHILTTWAEMILPTKNVCDILLTCFSFHFPWEILVIAYGCYHYYGNIDCVLVLKWLQTNSRWNIFFVLFVADQEAVSCTVIMQSKYFSALCMKTELERTKFLVFLCFSDLLMYLPDRRKHSSTAAAKMETNKKKLCLLYCV